MITVTFTKKEILYAIADQLGQLGNSDFGFLKNLSNLLEGKGDDDDVSVDVSGALLTQIHAGVSSYPHGVAKYMNPGMLSKIQTQLSALVGSNQEAANVAATIAAKIAEDAAFVDAKVAVAKGFFGI